MSARRGRVIRPGRALVYVALCVWALTTIYPFIWVLSNSFKPSGQVMADSFSLPLRPIMVNYINAIAAHQVLRGYLNSFIVSGSVTLLVMLMSAMLAFCMSRYRFRGRGVVGALLVGTLMFPAFSTIIPVFRMVAAAGMVNRHLGVIVPQTAGNLAFASVVMMGFFAGTPYELEEAAFMEGCDAYRIFVSVILPLARPSLATVGIFTFLWSYNDLFLQMIVLRGRRVQPVCALMREISSQFGTDFGLMAAAVAIVVMPVLVVYVLLQSYIVKGLTAGAVKG